MVSLNMVTVLQEVVYNSCRSNFLRCFLLISLSFILMGRLLLLLLLFVTSWSKRKGRRNRRSGGGGRSSVICCKKGEISNATTNQSGSGGSSDIAAVGSGKRGGERIFLVGLPLELVEGIVRHLGLADWVRVSCVCNPLREQLKAAALRRRTTEPPWLLLPPTPPKPGLLRFRNTSEARFYNFNLNRFNFSSNFNSNWDYINPFRWWRKKWSCCGSSQGWLVMAAGHGTRLFLLDPVSGTTVRLPSLKTLPFFAESFESLGGLPFYLNRLVDPPLPAGFSIASMLIQRIHVSSPAGVAIAVDFMVAAIFIYPRWECEYAGLLAICRPGDKKWTMLGGAEYYHHCYVYGDIVFHCGKLCAQVLFDHSTIEAASHVIDIHTVALTDSLHVQVVLFGVLHDQAEVVDDDEDEQLSEPGFTKYNTFCYYFVESTCGELLTVVQYMDVFVKENDLWYISKLLKRFLRLGGIDCIPYHTNLCQKTTRFKLFIENAPLDWKELSSVGDQALFLNSFGSSFSIPATNQDCLSRGDCIYFASSEHRGSHGIGVFHVRDQRIEHLVPGVEHSISAPSYWFLPKLQLKG